MARWWLYGGCAFFFVLWGGFWLQSELAPWESVWSDADQSMGYRLASKNGQLFYQTCQVGTILLDEADKQYPLKRPKDFLVGTPDPAKIVGTTIPCGAFPIFFADPNPQQWIGVHGSTSLQILPQEPSRWSASWSQAVVSYLLLTILSVLPMLIGLALWFRRRWRIESNQWK